MWSEMVEEMGTARNDPAAGIKRRLMHSAQSAFSPLILLQYIIDFSMTDCVFDRCVGNAP